MDEYQRRGYGGCDVGFGARIGIAVVDFQLAFTDPRFPMGGAPLIERAVLNTAVLLDEARRRGLPVVSCYTAYHSPEDAPHWKVPPVLELLHHGAECVQLDRRIHDPKYDVVFCKSAPSIFFHTPAAPIFMRQCVDTVIVVGCTTSGCVRASVIDAFSYGLRVIVPEDCVGDHEIEAHEANLRDVGRRYADILSMQAILGHLAG